MWLENVQDQIPRKNLQKKCLLVNTDYLRFLAFLKVSLVVEAAASVT